MSQVSQLSTVVKGGLAIGACVLCMHASPANAAEPQRANSPVSINFTVPQALGAPPAGVTDLRFRDFYRMPVGPKGLEPSQQLVALNGKKVRMVGFMVHQEQPIANRFILAHLPVSMSEDEDGLADDLPPNVVFVYVQHSPERSLTHLSGLLQFSGTLSVGPQEEVDGRVSNVRLLLDSAVSEAFLTVSPLGGKATH